MQYFLNKWELWFIYNEIEQPETIGIFIQLDPV